MAQAAEAVEGQRRRLIEVREEYEERRRVLAERARELEHERRELRNAQGEFVSARAEHDERTRELVGRFIVVDEGAGPPARGGLVPRYPSPRPGR